MAGMAPVPAPRDREDAEAMGRRIRSWVTAALLVAVALPALAECTGDCNGDGVVAVNELVAGVNIALGSAAVSSCPAFDANGDGQVTVNELIQAVNAALNGCPA